MADLALVFYPERYQTIVVGGLSYIYIKFFPQLIFFLLQENEDLLSTSGSSYEGFVARDHYALRLSPRPYTSLGPGRCGGK